MSPCYIIYLINVLSLLSPATPQPDRCQALINLNSMIDTRKDYFINRFYHQLVKSEWNASLLFTTSFSDKVVIPDRAFMLLIERSRYNIIDAAKLLYTCRRQWWGNKTVQDYMTKRIVECYPVPCRKNILEFSEKELNHLFRAIQCYGYAGRTSYKLPLLMLINDRRVVVNHDDIAGIGYRRPLPSRICDAVLYSLLLMYEVDALAVGQHYGYPFMFLPRNRPLQDRVVDAYDRMIDDFGSLNDRFFK